ncbi:diaminobutyrate acetyltransferase [Lentzea sp. NPDC051838]|uniref:diaminobutyrate acetyltransferase n=1 Tax=Lentzea sp. NPDC051838 TaxID=3154849 RepID=UPI0034423D07
MLGNRTKHGDEAPAPGVTIEVPSVGDGSEMWRIARDTGVLDLNSSYAYLLWARDFAATSVVAKVGTRPIGFVTGYLRPDEPETLFVWQVAVESSYRGAGVARTMLEAVVAQARARGARFLDTTITTANTASVRLFSALARDHGVGLERWLLFPAELFPDGHDSETLYRIGPWPDR